MLFSITRGWVGVQFTGKKRYVTLEWPLSNLVRVGLALGLLLRLG